MYSNDISRFTEKQNKLQQRFQKPKPSHKQTETRYEFFLIQGPIHIFNLILQDTLQYFIYGAQRLHSTHYTVHNESRKRRRRKAYIIQQIEVHSQHSSSFILNANFPRFIVNLALSCIQLLFTHRLHLPDKMSVCEDYIFISYSSISFPCYDDNNDARLIRFLTIARLEMFFYYFRLVA